MEQIVLFAVVRSALYALVALGFTLIFGVARVLNLSHGALLMAGAYGAYIGINLFHLNLYLSFALAVLATALLAIAIYKALVRRVSDSPVLVLIVTLAVAFILQEAIVLAFGYRTQIIPPPIEGTVVIAGTIIDKVQLLALAVSLVALGLFWLFIHRTRFGRAILATAQDPKGAALVGINPDRVYTLTWALSGALAGLAGLFFAYPGGIVFNMWVNPLVISFAIVILGGLGSIPGTLIAAYLIGFVETLTFYGGQLNLPLGPSWVGLPSLFILILLLIFRPQGLFGGEQASS
ncbi:MAG TPA: branched-chain amino acid ABC transporter permease [Candidatus Fraserbacteria bacterium]|nr:branched-chain amino acid ABC transporter permease [Candidatus Fraserbacteria bacterium]